MRRKGVCCSNKTSLHVGPVMLMRHNTVYVAVLFSTLMSRVLTLTHKPHAAAWIGGCVTLGLVKLELVFYGSERILVDCGHGIRKRANLDQPLLQCPLNIR